MLKRIIPPLLIIIVVLSSLTPVAKAAKGMEFSGVVKLIESHYRVKRKGMPTLANLGMKVARTAAAIWLAEAGKFEFAIFEDQDFSPPAGKGEFRTAIHTALHPEWHPLVLVHTGQGGEQTYIYTREAGEQFKVLVVTIGRRDATVLQVGLKPDALMQLMKNPETMGKELTDEATNASTDNDER